MDFDAVIRNRKSTRKFKSKKPGWKEVLEAVDSAIQGPFAANQNNLKFLIVEDKKRIGKIASCCEQEWIAESNMLVVACSDDSNLENIFGEKGRVYSRQQAGAAINTLCLKLADSGIASCWVGAYDDNALKELLEIPEQIQIEAVVPIGYSENETGKKNKRSLENVLYWEKWKANRRQTVFEEQKESLGKKILKDKVQ